MKIYIPILLLIAFLSTSCNTSKNTASCWSGTTNYRSQDNQLFEDDLSFDSEARFEYENQMKLQYTGAEVDIINKIEAGNVRGNSSNVDYGELDKSIIKERKIIQNADYRLSVNEVDSTRKNIENIAEQYNGYVQTSGTYETVIRIEAENMDQVLLEIESLGEIVYKNISGNDVSNNYYDAQIRLENALNSRTRYLELLEQAENVEAALLVEKELERLNQTIELLKAKMNNINHLSSYATITIKLQEKKKLGVLGLIGKGIYKGVKWLFVRN